MKLPTKVPCQKGLTPAISRALRMTSTSKRADGGAERRAEPAGQRGAADDGRGDDLEFVAGADRVGDGAKPADQEDRRDGHHESAKGIGGDLDEIDRDAGEARRTLIAADGEQIPAPTRIGQQEVQDDDADDKSIDHVGQAEGIAAAEGDDGLG